MKPTLKWILGGLYQILQEWKQLKIIFFLGLIRLNSFFLKVICEKKCEKIWENLKNCLIVAIDGLKWLESMRIFDFWHETSIIAVSRRFRCTSCGGQYFMGLGPMDHKFFYGLFIEIICLKFFLILVTTLGDFNCC